MKNRDTLKVKSADLIDFHAEFAKKFKFKVPLHPRNMAQLIHPFQGYLAAFSTRQFSFDELVAVYENQIAASFEKTTGRNLLGDELSALSLWMVQDEKL